MRAQDPDDQFRTQVVVSYPNIYNPFVTFESDFPSKVPYTSSLNPTALDLLTDVHIIKMEVKVIGLLQISARCKSCAFSLARAPASARSCSISRTRVPLIDNPNADGSVLQGGAWDARRASGHIYVQTNFSYVAPTNDPNKPDQKFAAACMQFSQNESRHVESHAMR